MISKAKIKFIKSLQIKKYRKQEQCFVVEGAKSVQELITSSYEPLMVIGMPAFLDGIRPLIANKEVELTEAGEAELAAMGSFQSNTTGLAVARMKPNTPVEVKQGEYALALDDLRDPGNVGTIIRIADWYGINKIIASAETADFYNPKVVTASMGSFTRVQFYYTELSAYLVGTTLPVFGAFLDGENIHQTTFGVEGIVVVGNESNGISADVGATVTRRITIPRFGRGESLNAAIATAIICDNLRR
ncbi:MAG: RNA methyltransferase [Bacteroidia bacterium]|nr:RNA methyltransferase [Bacteroidia bacterium]